MSDYGQTAASSPADLEKDADDTIRVSFPWASRLAGDTIDTSEFLLPDGLTEEATAGTGSERTVDVSGGNCGQVYRVTNRITTDGGLQLDWTKRVLVRER
jgi:hypothetical protein